MNGHSNAVKRSALREFFVTVVLGSLAMLMVDPARGSEPLPASDQSLNWSKEREFWSFRQPLPHPQPVVRNRRWPRQRLDYFILARLEEKQLLPSLEAAKRTLIRRVTYDLTGLPPMPKDVDAFLKDANGKAYERLVERLLASPRFGERMASLWLPLARYAEDQAHQVGSDTKFFYPNAYKYREWVIDAFNRDLPYDEFVKLQLAADKIESTNSPNLAALGFLGLGPKYYNRGRIEVMADEWEDRVDTVTRTFLGLTVSCSRCHDHKFDPVTTEDYYSLAGVFASTRMINRRPEGAAESDKTDAAKMDSGTLHVVEDGEPQDLNVFIRGNAERKGPVAKRRFLRVLSEGEPVEFKDGSGRRELAEAIACGHNPLTARVIVNRIWSAFFDKPLVPTASNFGHSGEPPTHPELLDDLASRFMQNGWSVKGLVREIVLSATYRQSSSAPVIDRRYSLSSEVDPANTLLSRMNRRRLTVEQWRDAVLFVSGRLDFSGGRSLELDDSANQRRTVHARVSRLKLNDLLMQFDYPDANVHAEKRAVSTTATQKLFMLNSPFVVAQAEALAVRLTADPKESENQRIERAYRLLFGREPEKAETKLGLEFLCKADPAGMSRWEQYAQLLLVSNEMLYVD
ncbi:MAG TPA: DUF1549 and DUF1553 domain-containing protein [Verrucomicrobiae bacterium]|nr:DUF1549 and DUF1553 domain-containing protein [Verrucomicrobiae bacterium]